MSEPVFLSVEQIEEIHRDAIAKFGGTLGIRDAGTLAVRWTGYANFELVYNGQVMLLDTYFDRGAMFPHGEAK